ncbi:hypothetical protein AADZ86_09410 [Colwelliaceae bacterium BS250]
MLIKMFNYPFNHLFNYQEKHYPGLIFSLNLRLDNDYITRLLAMCFLFLLAVTLVMLPAYYADVRLLNNAPIWAKPIKFSLSLAIHFLTLALLAQQLDRSRRTGMLLTFFAYLAVVSMLFEQIYISIQAARGRQSHYNDETDFEVLMYNLMGIGAINLILVSFVLGLLIWKYGNKDNSGLRLGSILGLVIGSVLTLVYAMTMANAPANSHLVGEAVSNTKVPLVGWSREVGDLRIPHFIATHMMQILPLTGLFLDKYKCSPKMIVSLSTVILVVMSAVFFDWALAGKAVFSI